MRVILGIIFLASFSFQALAEDAYEEAHTYAPDFCEFTITFPTAPYTTRRCDEKKQGECYDQISYTQVYDLEATVNFRVICNPIGKDIKNAYDGEVMTATLRAMTKDTVVETFETAFREEEHYKQAGLIGEGKVGRTPTIYIAQIWIGEHSAMTVEAELIGDAHDQADKLYSEVLKSLGYIDKKEKAENDKASSKEQSASE